MNYSPGWRQQRVGAFMDHLTRLYGRPPTEAEVAGAIASQEHHTPRGRQAVLEAFFNRQRVTGGDLAAHASAYDPAVGVGARWPTSTKAIDPHARDYESIAKNGPQILTGGQTHFFSPTGLDAYMRKGIPVQGAQTINGQTVPRWATSAMTAKQYVNVDGEVFVVPNERFASRETVAPTTLGAPKINQPAEFNSPQEATGQRTPLLPDLPTQPKPRQTVDPATLGVMPQQPQAQTVIPQTEGEGDGDGGQAALAAFWAQRRSPFRLPRGAGAFSRA